MIETEARTYTVEFDQEAYNKLWTLPVEARFAERERLDSYTDKQLQTLLAERFNVLTSTFYYDMKDGQLWGQDMNEPAIESFKRGKDYRKKHGSSVDWPREQAEIYGFEKIQEMLEEGKDVLSVSPQGGEGSIYKHKFYDVFRRKDGKVETKRYSSALDIVDYKKLLGVEHQTPEEFLANPIDISSVFSSAEDVHKYLHKDHEYTSDRVFNDYILPGTRPARYNLLQAYYNGDIEGQEYWSNVMLNGADEIDQWAKGLIEQEFNVSESRIEFSAVDYARLAMQPVREVSTGCGASGGFGLSKNSSEPTSPWSVSEFGKKDDECGSCKQSTEDDHYHCPGCGGSYESERNKSASTRTKVCGKQSGDGYPCGFKFAC